MADSTLGAIVKKVRRLTRSPSTSQITDTEIHEYINTFVLYDFPEHLRLFALRTTITFYTSPNVDTYDFATIDATSPLFNYKNLYITTHEPLYINGKQIQFTQSREKFYAMFPVSPKTDVIAYGDGVTVNYAGQLTTIGTPILPGSVLFSAVDTAGNPLLIHDNPQSGIPNVGLLIGDTGGVPNTINYLTGAYVFTLSAAPGAGQAVNAAAAPYTPSIPLAVLAFDYKYIVRPIPDKAYAVEMEVYKRPTEFINNPAALPYLDQWWQYIAYGAAKKIFEDRFDNDSVQAIMPEFKTQEALVLRTTIVQQTKERVMTIFSQANSDW